MIGKILEFLGVKSQLRTDLAALVAVVMAYVAQAEKDFPGPGTGPAKKKQVLDQFFDSVEKEGGIDLPRWCTGKVARLIVSELIDFLVSLANGGKSGN